MDNAHALVILRKLSDWYENEGRGPYADDDLLGYGFTLQDHISMALGGVPMPGPKTEGD